MRAPLQPEQPEQNANAAAPPPQPQTLHVWRPKGYLSPVGLTVLLSLVAGTLLMVMARLLATPGMPLADWPLLDALSRFGALLDQTLTLAWVPPSNLRKVIYLLLLPSAALLIAIARLTFGLRVFGFRSVLVAVAFHELGVLPSLVVMAAVLGFVVWLRPTMRRVRLPLYARISIILAITACILIAALLVGSWLRSELIWSLAFFPVIILAMMAEAFAGTLDQHSLSSALWRLGWTLVIALLLLALMNSPTVVGALLRFPELMLTQLLAIVLVSEYLDLRLFQDWQSSSNSIAATLSGLLYENPAEMRRKPRVAVVRNRSRHGTIGRLGPAAPDKSRVDSVQHIVDALRDEGYAVKVFEGDMMLLRELRKFLPPHPRTGAPGGVALNLSVGIQGHGRLVHVPAMLEMAGVAYTGPDPIAQARQQDRHTLLSSLQQAGIAVAPFWLLRGPGSAPADLVFPALVSPRHEHATDPISVKTPGGLASAVEQIVARHGQEVLVQARLGGPEFRVTVLGNARVECLPLLRIDSSGRQRECPASIDDALAERIRDCARRAYRAAGCRDYARIDLRLDANGEPCVVGVQAQDILAKKGSVAIMAKAAGLGWGGLARRIVELAAARNGAESAEVSRSNNIVSLASATEPAAFGGKDAASFATGAR